MALAQIVGLEPGADDYLVEPFSPRELVARIRAVLRRATDRAEGGAPTRLSPRRAGFPQRRSPCLSP